MVESLAQYGRMRSLFFTLVRFPASTSVSQLLSCRKYLRGWREFHRFFEDIIIIGGQNIQLYITSVKSLALD